MKPALAAVLILELAGAAASPVIVEVLPEGAQTGDRLPVVIAIHGRGADAQRFAAFVKRLSPAVRILSIQAPAPFESGGFTWFDTTIGSDTAGLRLSVEQRAQQLRSVIAHEVKTRPTCGAPVVVGYSQGGALALALASTGAPIAAAIEVAGALPSAFEISTAPRRVHGFHGTADPVIPFALAQSTFSRGPRDGGWTLSSYGGVGHGPSEAMLADIRTAIAEEIRRTCPVAGRDAGAN